MSYKLEIETSWIGDGLTTATSFRPELVSDYPSVDYVDVTNQDSAQLPPDPNLFVISVVCDEATKDSIEADTKYNILTSTELE